MAQALKWLRFITRQWSVKQTPWNVGEYTDTNKLSELTAKQRWDNMALYKMVSIYDSDRKSQWLLGSTWIRHRYEAFAFNWCLITVDLDVFAILDLSSATRLFTAGNSVIYTTLYSINGLHPRHTQLVLPRTRHIYVYIIVCMIILYSISQEICTRYLLCCALLWLYIDWFSHIHQAYFTGTVAI